MAKMNTFINEVVLSFSSKGYLSILETFLIIMTWRAVGCADGVLRVEGRDVYNIIQYIG